MPGPLWPELAWAAALPPVRAAFGSGVLWEPGWGFLTNRPDSKLAPGLSPLVDLEDRNVL